MNTRLRLLALLAVTLASALLFGGCKKRGLPGAREKIEAWNRSWQASRACLLGDHGTTSSTAVALLVRDIADPHGSTAIAQCVAQFTALEHEPSDVEEIEAAWLVVDTAVKRLASLLPDYATSDEKTRHRLARLIDDVDTAYVALREKAGMAATESSSSKPVEVSKAPEGLLITDRDGAPLEVASVELAGDTLTLVGRTELIVFRGPDAIERFSVAEGVVPSLGDASWGVRLDRRGELRSAPLDASGELSGAGKVVARKKVPGFKDTVTITPYYAVGKAKKRVIIYEREFVNGIAEVWLQVSHDGGRTWQRAVYIPYAGSRISPHPSWALAQVHLTWDYTGRLHWLPVGEATLGSLMKERTLRKSTQRTSGAESCFGASRVWFVVDRGVIRVEQDGKAPPQILSWEVPPGAVYYCDDDHLAAVVHEGNQVVIHECGAGGCRKPWRLARRGASFTTAAFAGKRGLVAATLVEDHLMVFERTAEGETRARVAFRAQDAYLAALVHWNGALFGVLQQPGRARLVPLP